MQWKIALQGNSEYYNAPGVSLEQRYIEERVYEWTKVHPRGKQTFDKLIGARPLDQPLNVNLIKEKNCIDIGCGMGRWTKTMLKIGAKTVLSIDISASALESVKRFNSNVRRVNIMEIMERHRDLIGKV